MMEKPSRRELMSRLLGLAREPLLSALPASVKPSRAARAPVSPSLSEQTASAVNHPRAALIAALLAAAALPYLNILLNGFVYDDHTQVTNNPYLQNLHHLRDIFTTTAWSYVGAQGVTNYYRPLMTLGYLACYRAFGPLAYGFHLASLMLHVLAVCLVFVVTERITADRVWAFAAGTVFALHPIHTESVAWIAAVTDVELTVFYLLTFAFFVSLARPGGKTSLGRATAMAAAFILALLSKEQALTLPVLATVYEHFYREDRSRTRRAQKLVRYGPLWLVGAAYMFFRVHFMGALAPVQQMRSLTAKEVVFSAMTLIGEYMGKLLWPARLCAFYVFHRSSSLADPRVLAGAVALGALSLLFVVLARSRDANIHFASFGILWLVVTLAPVLNAHWMAANVFAERYLYLPSVGFCWLVGFGFSALWRRSRARVKWRRPLVAGGLVLAAACALRIIARNRDWRDDITLYTRTLAQSPDAYPILNNLGAVYWQDGRLKDAEDVWRRALALSPASAIVLNNLGLAATRQGHYADAVALFDRAIKLKPKYTDPHLNLGTVYRLQGLSGAAEIELRTAATLSPLDISARNELGQLLMDEGRFDEAEEQFRASIRSERSALAYDCLGEIELRRGDAREAESAFRSAVVVDRFDSRAHFDLGKLCAAAGRKDEALNEYRTGLMSDPTNNAALAAIGRLAK